MEVSEYWYLTTSFTPRVSPQEKSLAVLIATPQRLTRTCGKLLQVVMDLQFDLPVLLLPFALADVLVAVLVLL